MYRDDVEKYFFLPLTLIQICSIVLKILGYITVSYFWVMLPLMIMLGFIVFIFLFIGIAILVEKILLS